MVELFVDPGLITGWALFTDKVFSACDRINSRRLEDPMLKATYIADGVRAVLQKYQPAACFLEGVDMRGGRGNYSAIMRGDLTRLAYLVGSLQSVAASANCDAYIVSPLWKGNLPKAAMQMQVKLMCPDIITTTIREHEMDAVAMGVFKYADRWIKNWRLG